MIKPLHIWPLGIFAAIALASPARGDTPEQLDALVDATTAEASGIALARKQAAAGQWLEALATLDRVLALYPKSRPARLLQVGYLCQIDDKPGGLVVMAKLKRKKYPKADWAATLALCGQEPVK